MYSLTAVSFLNFFHPSIYPSFFHGEDVQRSSFFLDQYFWRSVFYFHYETNKISLEFVNLLLLCVFSISLIFALLIFSYFSFP